MNLPAWLLCCAVVPFSIAGGEPPAHWIGIHELDRVLAEQRPVVVDLRTPAEYDRGHVHRAGDVALGS
jgi:hypothetical protein